MYRWIFVFIGFVFLVNTAKAQDFKLGYVAGASITQVDGDNLSGYNKIGPHVGLFVQREITPKIHLKAEFLLTTKGAKNFVDLSNVDNPLKTAFYYIEVPLLVMVPVEKFFIEGGPSFGVLAYAYNRNHLGRYATTGQYDRLEWAGHLGLTYQWKNNRHFYARFSYSLTCVDGTCGSLLTPPRLRPGYYHNVISFGLRGYFGE